MSADVSVVIPTFNRAGLIAETLDSILGQTLPAAEVIVVDDGSLDDTEKAVGRYAARVRYHRIENSGPSRARNVGVSLARSRWIAFCDSDDLWLPEKLERQMRIHDLFPDVEYSFTDFTIVESGHWLPGSKFAEASPDYWGTPSRGTQDRIWVYDAPILDRVLDFQPIFVSTLVMSRRRYEDLGGYDEKFSRALAEDLEFTLRNAMRPPIGVLAEPLVGIRRHPGNNSGNFLGVLLGEVKILEYALATHTEAAPFRHAIANQIEWRRSLAIDQAFAAGRLDLVRELSAGIGARYRDWKLSTKIGIARLPSPLAWIARRVLVTAGTGVSQARHRGAPAP
jgi:glycosyltransferase involved in cell wall biosynthesis